MDTTGCEAERRNASYLDIETKGVQPNVSTEPHQHGLDVRALGLTGEITLTSEGAFRTCRAGEPFEMAAGCVHSERDRLDGSPYLVGRRRRPAAG